MCSARLSDRPLIADHRPAWVIVAIGALVAVVLAAVVWHGTTTAFDTWAFRRASSDFPPSSSPGRRAWLLFSEPAVSFLVPAGVAIWGALTRRWNVALLAAVGPALALGLTELIGKPLVGRVLGPGVLRGSTVGALSGSYPSGHETGLVSWLVLLLVVVFRAPVTRTARASCLAVAVLWALAGGVGLTVNYYHYATDTIGAVGLATATVLGVALLIDRCLTRAATTATAGAAPGQLTWRS